MGCGPCFQVKANIRNTPSEDNKSNNSQIQDINDLTDAANNKVKNFETPLHSDKKNIINCLENVNENNINNNLTNIGESQNPNIINHLPHSNENMKNIYDSNNKKEENEQKNINWIQPGKLFNNPNEIINYLNKKDASELIQSNNGYFNIGSKTNIFDINKSKNYNIKTNNNINNFKEKNYANPNKKSGIYVINE